MKSPSTGTSTRPNPARGPSLYSADAPCKDPLEGLSILGALEPARSRSRLGRRGLLVFLTVLLLLPATYLVATSAHLRHSMPLLALAVPVWEVENAKSPVASSMRPPATAAPSEAAQEASAATIVAEASARPALLPEAPAAPSLEKEPTFTAVAPEVEPVPEPARQNETAAAIASGSSIKSRRRPEAKDVTSAPAARSGPQAPAYSSTARGGKNKDGDKDVDLIAALLTHISRRNSTDKDAKYKSSGISGPSVASAETPAKREQRAAPNYDIVMQSAGESKASLISRCRALGFLEGELCRIRICSGSWGSDPSCSMDSAVRGGD